MLPYPGGMASAGEQAVSGRRIRILLVDDSKVVRFAVRALLDTDDRFEVVGEGENGLEAVALAAELDPDLVIIDRQMPVMGGLEAIGPIHEKAPHAEVVLYTAFIDGPTTQAAIAAGAADVLEKGTAPLALVDDLTEILLRRWGGDRGTEVRVGPVPPDAARVWISNTRTIVDALRARPDVVEVPADVLDLFEDFLTLWDDVASANEEFVWTARAPIANIRRLVEQWVVVNDLTDEQMAELGCRWAPPEGQPFFDALVAGVAAALDRHAETEQLAATLREQWPAWNDPEGRNPSR